MNELTEEKISSFQACPRSEFQGFQEDIVIKEECLVLMDKVMLCGTFLYSTAYSVTKDTDTRCTEHSFSPKNVEVKLR